MSSSSSSSTATPFQQGRAPNTATVAIDYSTQIIVSSKEWSELQAKTKSAPQLKAEGEASAKKTIGIFLGVAFLILIISTVLIIAFVQDGYAHSDKLINIITTMVGGLLGYSAAGGKQS